jgi:hypothetical protein
MRLDDQLKQKLDASLGRTLPEHGCPFCRSSELRIADRIFYMADYDAKGMVLGGPTIPVVAVICLTCGHTMLFNAVVLGLVPSGDADKKEAPTHE